MTLVLGLCMQKIEKCYILEAYVRSLQGFSTLSVKHHSEKHILVTTNTLRKQNKRPNRDLKTEHKRTTNRTTIVQAPRLYITKTHLCNFDPLKPHFYIVKLGFTGVYIIFLISAQKHRLWVLVRTAFFKTGWCS